MPSWKKVITSGSDAALQSLTVSTTITANSFKTPTGSSTQFLMADGSVSTLTNNVTGTGTTNYLSKFTASGIIGDSIVYDNGTNVGIGTTSPSEKLEVNGNIKATSFIKSGGTSNQFLKADGSIDGNSYLTSYTETDTLASVTARGASTSTLSTFDGGLNIGNAKLRWGGTTSPTLGFPFTGGPNAFWIDVNDGDTGGIALDNDGTTIYGAGDSGHVFRVIDEDVYQETANVDASTTFRIQQGQNGGGYVRGNFEITNNVTANSFIKSGGTATQFLMADGNTNTYGTTAGTVAEGNHTHTFASITSKPTTLSGYGITDALSTAGGTVSGELIANIIKINKTVMYSPNTETDILNIRRYANDYTILNVWSPPQTSWGKAKEATLSIVRGDNNEYSMNLYNMDYGTADAGNNLDYGSPVMGLRLQKRGTGVYTPFYFEYEDGINSVKALELLPNNTSGTTNNTTVKVSNNLLVGNISRFEGEIYTTKNIYLQNNGTSVGIGTTSPSYPLHVATQVSNTSIYADYDIVAFSDISVKNNIRPIDNVLERVINSRGVLYDRIDSGEKNNIGFIAQELEEQFPELVVENPDGTKAVKYQNAVAILFEAIKEQQKQIDELKELIKNK